MNRCDPRGPHERRVWRVRPLLAPGVVYGYRRRRRLALWRWCKTAAALVVWSALIGLWLGMSS